MNDFGVAVAALVGSVKLVRTILLYEPGLYECFHDLTFPVTLSFVMSLLLSSGQVAYSSPVSPENFGSLAVLFVAAGLTVMSLSFVQQMNAKSEGSIVKELPLVLMSSALLGFGSLFVLLWSGVYV